jgi:hypothetical protein
MFAFCRAAPSAQRRCEGVGRQRAVRSPCNVHLEAGAWRKACPRQSRYLRPRQSTDLRAGPPSLQRARIRWIESLHRPFQIVVPFVVVADLIGVDTFETLKPLLQRCTNTMKSRNLTIRRPPCKRDPIHGGVYETPRWCGTALPLERLGTASVVFSQSLLGEFGQFVL